MVRSRSVDIVLLVLLAIGLLTGTRYLMIMRFSTGDVYPPYSSLRTDPLGCKALYDTLVLMEGVDVRRHFTGVGDIETGYGDTVFVLGLRTWDLARFENEFENLAGGGTRVVAALNEHPRRRAESEETGSGSRVDEGDPSDEGSADTDDGNSEHDGRAWDLTVKNSGAQADTRGRYKAFLAEKLDDLPGEITLTSPVYFDTRSDKWQVIYELPARPVILERKIGKGSVVLISNSYPLSNEALRWDLHPRLLLWLLSESGGTVFVESHLGVRENQGVMTLVRRYRLVPLLLCLTVIAFLAVWKNAVPLVIIPGSADADSGHIVSEKDQFTGLVSLLKRNIDPAGLLRLCFAELKKGPRVRKGQSDDIENMLREFYNRENRDKDPVVTYNRITRKLSERAGE